jgi:pyridoxal phosphate enzyme (YggS family)
MGMLATLPKQMAGTTKATTLKGAARTIDASHDASVAGTAMKSATTMQPPKDTRTLRERYDDVRARVAAAAERSGRRPSDIMLVAVTKHASIEDIRELVSYGHVDLGENRVQQMVQRAAMIEEFAARRRDRGAAGDAPAVRWHMIGSLQRNKVRAAIEVAKLIHSVDSLRLAEELQEHAEERSQAPGGENMPPVDVLVEVNVAGERTKHGVAPAAARHLVDMIDTMVALRPRGLMCMAPNTGSLDDARRVFTRCKELFDEIRAIQSGGERFDILSMGMSGDYEVAIECGANLVRVGSAIFGDPKPGMEEQEDE